MLLDLRRYGESTKHFSGAAIIMKKNPNKISFFKNPFLEIFSYKHIKGLKHKRPDVVFLIADGLVHPDEEDCAKLAQAFKRAELWLSGLEEDLR